MITLDIEKVVQLVKKFLKLLMQQRNKQCLIFINVQNKILDITGKKKEIKPSIKEGKNICNNYCVNVKLNQSACSFCFVI